MTPESLASDPAHIAYARKTARIMAAQRGLNETVAEELESAALEGLWDAARSFDPKRKTKFIATHAARRIKGAILDEMRRMGGHGFGSVSREKRRGEFDPPVSLDLPGRDGRPVGHSWASDELPVGWEIEDQDEAEKLARRAGSGIRSSLVRAMLTLAASRGTQDGAARCVGISPSRASQVFKEFRAGGAA